MRHGLHGTFELPESVPGLGKHSILTPVRLHEIVVSRAQRKQNYSELPRVQTTSQFLAHCLEANFVDSPCQTELEWERKTCAISIPISITSRCLFVLFPLIDIEAGKKGEEKS